MTYLIFCTFDLKNASAADYKNAYSDLENIGLKKVHKGSNGKNVVIPTTAAMGEFNGTSVGNVRDDICNQVQNAFSKRGFKSEIFIIVGGDWAWGSRTTWSGCLDKDWRSSHIWITTEGRTMAVGISGLNQRSRTPFALCQKTSLS